MPNYRRAFIKGGTFFFTVVTYGRYPIFKEEPSINLLLKCFETTMVAHPFTIDAVVVLPDHLHTIWTLPEGDSDFSTRWKMVKGAFSRRYSGDRTGDISESMYQKHEKGIWQRRFWEHVIRDEADFNRHCDYIHYNPVKHGLVSSPADWKYSSFGHLVEKGIYPSNWGPNQGLAEMDFE